MSAANISATGGVEGVLFFSKDFFQCQEIEIVAAMWNALGAFQQAIADRRKGDPRRQSEGFLARGQRDIDAPIVHAQFRSQEAADGIDEIQGIGVLLDDLPDCLNGICDAGAGFIVHDAHGIVALFGKRFGDHLWRMRLTPWQVDAINSLSVGFADPRPAFAEGATGQVQNFPVIADSIATSAFPQAAAR